MFSGRNQGIPASVSNAIRSFQDRLPGDFPELDELGRRYGSARCAIHAEAGQRMKAALRAGKPIGLATAIDAGKQEACRTFDLPGRLFNAIRCDLLGMTRSKQEKATHDLADIVAKISAKNGHLGRETARFEALPEQARSRKAARKVTRGRLAVERLEGRARELATLAEDPHPPICFGSRHLFTAGNFLSANRYASHGEWRRDWREARASEVFFLGSGDEPGGNRTCRATIRRLRIEDWIAERDGERRRLVLEGSGDDRGSRSFRHGISLRGDTDREEMLRRMAEADDGFVSCVDLSLALTAEKKVSDPSEDQPERMRTIPPEHLTLRGLILPHGHAEWLDALRGAEIQARAGQVWQRETAALIQAGRLAVSAARQAHNDGLAEAKRKSPEQLFRAERMAIRKQAEKSGSAISYRFTKDHFGWRVFVCVTQAFVDPAFIAARGVLGVDFNQDHLAVVETDALGNFLSYARIELPLRGRTSGQRSAAMHDACHALILLAFHLAKPLVIEALDFARKKRSLADASPAAARRLSSLAYAAFHHTLRAHARLRGVAVEDVSPAWTSIQGAVAHATDLGLSVHGAAALVIARRRLGIVESSPDSAKKVLLGGRVVWLDVVREAQWSCGKDRPDDWHLWAKAIKAERAAHRRNRTTGRKRRAMARARRDLDLDRAFFDGLPFAGPGGNPGETRRAAMTGAVQRSAA